MVKLTFIQDDGSTQHVDVPEGTTVMRAALDNSIPGIEGDCGGVCACATCHVYIDDPRVAEACPRESQEDSMLSFSPILQPNSRLACQIHLTAALDDLVVTLPKNQF